MDTAVGANKTLIKFKDLPGPKGIPFAGNIFQIDRSKIHQKVESWTEEFGSVFKIKMGPYPLTVVTDSEIIQAMLRARPDTFLRQQKMGNILNEAGAQGVFTAEGEAWKRERKIVAQSLDVKHQKAFFNAIKNPLQRLKNKWETNAQKNEWFDIQDDLVRFTVDVTTSLAFGIEMNTIEQEGGKIQDHMEKIFPMIFKRINEPFPWYKWIKSKNDRIFDIALKEIHQLIDEFIEEGKKRLFDHPELIEHPENFLDAILSAARNEEHFGDTEIKGNLLTLLMAGEDTTAYSLAWSIAFLANQPEFQEYIHAEAKEIFGQASIITDYADHSKLTFTQSVGLEAMRLKPVAPLLLMEPTVDFEFKGFLFEKGAKILTQSRYGATHSDHFQDPKVFNPKRWLENKRSCPGHNTEAFMPFGSGPRLCPGMNLAILEMKAVLSMLCNNFTIHMKDKVEDIEEIMAFTMKPGKFQVRLEKRN